MVALWSRPVNRHVPSPQARCRPRLHILEDRTLLSPVVFNEIQNQSPLTLSGQIAGRDIQPQGNGALTTTYFGTFQTNIDMANSLIQFIGGGNDFCAANTGNWAPQADGSDGTAPAIYGLQVNIRGIPFRGAVRDYHMEADTSGNALPLSPNADGSFGFPSWQNITINAGTGTFSFPTLVGSGPIVFSGLAGPNQAGDGNLIVNGNGTFHITVPISVTYNTIIGGVRSTLNINGQIVGEGAYSGSASHFPGIPVVTGVVSTSAGWIGTNRLAATGMNSDGATSENPQSVTPSTQATTARVPDAPLGNMAAPLVHHAIADGFDPFTILRSDEI
jgi:hypothetical protein